MNSKLIKASLAGVAAIAVTAGGTTFAAWSDFAVLDTDTVGADYLTLDVDDTVNAANFDKLNFYPGGGGDFEFVVASRNGEAVPNASLRMAIANLVSDDNGCAGNSEAVAEGSPVDGLGNPTNTTLCDDASSAYGNGEFDDQALINVNTSAVIPNIDSVGSAACSSTYPRGSVVAPISIRDLASGAPVSVLPAGETLQAGEGLCVALAIALPVVADNAVQTDTVDFNLQFLLDQIVP